MNCLLQAGAKKTALLCFVILPSLSRLTNIWQLKLCVYFNSQLLFCSYNSYISCAFFSSFSSFVLVGTSNFPLNILWFTLTCFFFSVDCFLPSHSSSCDFFPSFFFHSLSLKHFTLICFLLFSSDLIFFTFLYFWSCILFFPITFLLHICLFSFPSSSFLSHVHITSVSVCICFVYLYPYLNVLLCPFSFVSQTFCRLISFLINSFTFNLFSVSCLFFLQ